MTLDEYRTAVSRELVRRYAISWDDADGGDDRLVQALNANESPEDFVAWLGEKYDLTPREADSPRDE